ncbi:Homoserine kinase [hydrothermal vent metagenome]|uniref:Homoserine kinase n=1 Tax=hydrothermal vent metagenome TaxID=652676 RepID=A0A3B0WPB3_9ZZZZ
MIFPVIHSVLSCKALSELILENYDLKSIEKIEYFQTSLTDTYLINADKKKYILRAYRTHWRSKSDIQCEIDALNFLAKNQISVATPIAQKNKETLIQLNAPEGLRYLILFNYASGHPPCYADNYKHEAEIYGKAFGKMHKTLENFNSPHQRFKLDINYLLNEPLNIIEPYLKRRQKDWATLTQLAKKLKQQYLSYPKNSLQYGFCHGDLNTGNVHIDNNNITLFDFDCCGYGYHAADISNYLWGARTNKIENKIWPIFLEAYLKENTLNRHDLEAIPMFANMRHIWHMGLHLKLSEEKGTYWIDDHYFSKQIELLKNWK